MSWYLEVLRKFAVFGGRARRKEYWYFFLFNIIISIILAAVDGATGNFDHEAGMGMLGGIYMLAALIPGIAVSVRRLHDTDRSGWFLLIGLIPIIGAVVLFVFMVQNSKSGQNRYGRSPKEATA